MNRSIPHGVILSHTVITRFDSGHIIIINIMWNQQKHRFGSQIGTKPYCCTGVRKPYYIAMETVDYGGVEIIKISFAFLMFANYSAEPSSIDRCLS